MNDSRRERKGDRQRQTNRDRKRDRGDEQRQRETDRQRETKSHRDRDKQAETEMKRNTSERANLRVADVRLGVRVCRCHGERSQLRGAGHAHWPRRGLQQDGE